MMNCAAPGRVVLEVRAMAKSFGAVEALKDISLTLRAGSVHTLLGENGAGKSTLMKILAGVHQPSRGQMFLDGQELRLAGPRDARRCGIAIIHQELSLAGNLSVADNLFAHHPPGRAGWIDDREMLRAGRKLLAEWGIAIDASAQVAQLTLAERQLVEIAKALNQPARVVIMDEPTSSLGASEVELLFRIIEGLKSQGKAIVYISHRIDEVMRISDEISVLRDGQYLGTKVRGEASAQDLIALMVGRPMRDLYPPRPPAVHRTRPALLRVEGLSVARRFQGLDFAVHAGEIVGFFGLVGAGRSDVMAALFGIHRASGRITLDGQAVQIRCPADAIAHGMAFVTENRKEQGLVLDQSVLHNITMVHVHCARKAAWWTDESQELRLAQRHVQALGIRLASLHQPVRELSGGNQQKVVFAKWLALRPRVLILDEPTRGIDVGAKFEIYRTIRELAAAGTAVLLVSSELPEVLALSERLLVMRAKRLVKTFGHPNPSAETVMAYATGAAAA
ncbi:sugar ABC transporter ATP-binding protein [Verminephrobacter aporrectodeae subsp. tuberculatae]|nr:sugar ABC transporter ATP-binding protein [Verminephrobacter aporrectodeae subsp. tuberculatae]